MPPLSAPANRKFRWQMLLERSAAGRAIRVTVAASEIHDQAEHEGKNRALLGRQDASIVVMEPIISSPDGPQSVFERILLRAPELSTAEGAKHIDFDGTLMHQRTWLG